MPITRDHIMLPSPETVRAAATALGERYVSEEGASDLYAINDGQCEDFAVELAEILGGERDGIEMWWADNLSLDGEGSAWDVPLIERLWPASVPTHGLDWDDVRNEVPAHCWLVVDGRHYDAECPGGVENMFEIPLMRRIMERLSGQPSLDGRPQGQPPSP